MIALSTPSPMAVATPAGLASSASSTSEPAAFDPSAFPAFAPSPSCPASGSAEPTISPTVLAVGFSSCRSLRVDGSTPAPCVSSRSDVLGDAAGAAVLRVPFELGLDLGRENAKAFLGGGVDLGRRNVADLPVGRYNTNAIAHCAALNPTSRLASAMPLTS
jgi:hypothetical protein